MALILPKVCSMGGSKTGLVGTIGVALLKPDGTVHVARSIAGIYEIGGGCYGKNITFDDSWEGSIKWDTGGGSPVYAVEEYGMEGMLQNVETDTNDLQTNQGSWLTATGFAVPNEYNTEFTTLQADSTYMLKIIKNKKVLTKTGAIWQLIIYDDDDITPILTKDILDKDGNNITGLEAGILAQELKSVV